MWTDDRADRVRRLWEGGQHSAADIAVNIGDTSRSAVMSLVKRRGWNGGSTPGRTNCGGRFYTHDHDAILTRWEIGQSEVVIGEALGIPARSVCRIVCAARKRGDPRAVYHGRSFSRGPRKPRAAKPRATKPPPSIARRVQVRGPIEDMVVPISLGMTLLDLGSSQCHWPVNDPPKGEAFLFCGRHSFNSLPYCEYHSRLAYQPPESQGRSDRNARYLMRRFG